MTLAVDLGRKAIKQTNKYVSSFCIGNTCMGTLVNSEDPDEMPHNVRFHKVVTVC